MPSNKKRRIRERREKTGESYATARTFLDAAIAPKLPSVTTEWFFPEGDEPGKDDPLPQVETVSVMDFDGKDRDKAWVPESAFKDPSLPVRPNCPPETQRVLTLAEYIRVRERQTGWRLFALQPHGEFMGMFLIAILSWDNRTKRQRGEK